MTEKEIYEGRIEDYKKTIKNQEREIDNLQTTVTVQEREIKLHIRYVSLIEKLIDVKQDSGYDRY